MKRKLVSIPRLANLVPDRFFIHLLSPQLFIILPDRLHGGGILREQLFLGLFGPGLAFLGERGELGVDLALSDLGGYVPVGVVVAGLGAFVDLGRHVVGYRVVQQPQLDLDKLALVGLLEMGVFGHRDTGVPVLLAEAEVVRVDEVLDLGLDLPGVRRHVFLAEELLVPGVIQFLVVAGADMLHPGLALDLALVLLDLPAQPLLERLLDKHINHWNCRMNLTRAPSSCSTRPRYCLTSSQDSNSNLPSSMPCKF